MLKLLNLNENRINLKDFLFLLIPIISLVSLILLVIGIYKEFYVLIVSLLLLFVSIPILKLKIDIIKKIDFSRIALFSIIILSALLVRVGSKDYIMGGQDEGIYVNMSHYFSNHGQVFPDDTFRESLPKDLKKYYDKENRWKTFNNTEGKYEGLYRPGIYIRDSSESKNVFQFYHLHPLWMSFISWVTGAPRHSSLIFFGILTILYLFGTIELLTGNTILAFLVSLLFSFNPLHVYFSKFPVSENLSLFFLMACFFYLSKDYISIKDNISNKKYLAFSSFALCCLFFTRISGFMFIPFFYFLVIYMIISNVKYKKEIILFCLAVIFFYILSVIYGRLFSYPYSNDIHNISFSRFLGSNWEIRGLFVVALLAIIPVFLFIFKKIRRPLLHLVNFIMDHIYILYIIVIIISIYKIYKLGFTNHYEGHPWLDHRFHITNTGFMSLFRTSLFTLVFYSSPVIFVLFLISLFKSKKDIFNNLLKVFVLMFFSFSLIMKYIIHYQYYYARYHLSETIPFIILFTAIMIPKVFKRIRVSYIILILSIVLNLIITIPQLRYSEADYIENIIDENIDKYLNDGDILLADSAQFDNRELYTTYKYTYDLDIFSYSYNDLENIIEKLLTYHRNDIFILATGNIYRELSYLEIENEFKLKILTSNSPKNHLPILRYYDYEKGSTLYRLNKEMFKTREVSIEPNVLVKNKKIFLGNVDGFYKDNVWSKGYLVFNDVPVKGAGAGEIIVKTYGWNPMINNIDLLNLKLLLNNTELELISSDDGTFVFSFNELESLNKIEIFSSTFIPKDHGISNDSRELGLDIHSIRIIMENDK